MIVEPPSAVFETLQQLSPDLSRRNTDLMLSASQRWQDCHEHLHGLITTLATVRSSIVELLRDNLHLDSEQVSLFLPDTSQAVPLTDVFAWAAQNPALDTAQAQTWQVRGLPQNHPHALDTAAQLLERFRSLDLRQHLISGWEDFWNTRSRGTALSRRQHAQQLYRGHLEAVAEYAYADGQLNAEQLTSVLATFTPPESAQKIVGRRYYVEQLSLKQAGQFRDLHGALVFTLDTDQPVAQILYAPTLQPPMQVFRQRTDMELWLLENPHLFNLGPDIDFHQPAYRFSNDPVQAGFESMLAQLYQTRLESALSGVTGTLATHAAQALHNTDRVDQLRHEKPLLAPPPPLEQSQVKAGEITPFPFGALTADIPADLRQAAVLRQHQALQTLFGKQLEVDLRDPRLVNLQRQFEKLHELQQATTTAASALIYRERVLDVATINTQFTLLYQHRLASLRIEADIQRQLQHIDALEYQWLVSGLDRPNRLVRRSSSAAASISLVDTISPGASYPLDGVLVFTDQAALSNPDAPHSLLLYWPGHSGGLHRFASRDELQRSLFYLLPGDTGATLHLTPITGDPLEFSLRAQHSAFEQQAASLRAQPHAAEQAERLASELQALGEQTITRLQVPINAARELALEQLIEQQRSGELASRLPSWLEQLPTKEREQLKGLIEQQMLALQKANAIHELKLPAAIDFAQTRVDAWLRQEFSLNGTFSVSLDLPDSVSTEYHSVEGAAPGTPVRPVQIPDKARSTLAVHELALLNINESMGERLGFMKVMITASDPLDEARLNTGITVQLLRRMATDMNLAQHYENLIREVYRAPLTEPLFEREYRRECLLEPYRLLLQIQGRMARAEGILDEDALQTLLSAIDADSPLAWQPAGKRIVLHPSYLSTGGADTNDLPSTLSGVTFIEEQISGITLLYLPDSPDGQPLRRFRTLEQARLALFRLCLHSTMVDYFAARALTGTPDNHRARINQAVLKHFDGLIGIGLRWPAHTSLASHLLDAEMGRLIETHRRTSRSNDDLYREQYALKGERLYGYVKMAIGVVPIVGTFISLYDAWASANEAVKAFAAGDHKRGMAEVNAVLLSLIDAAMDLLPGVKMTSGTARARALQRQLRHTFPRLTSLPASSARKARHIAARFDGYDYKKAIDLSGLQPESQGFYRNVYRHAEGDFIVRDGKVYQVELQDRTLRLKGTRLKGYKQPIALDANGRWDTHYAVYGTTLDGGLLGGGQVLGHLAEGMDPLWPAAIRRWLPRWFADRAYRRQEMLASRVNADRNAVKQLLESIEETAERYRNTDLEGRLSLGPSLDALEREFVNVGKRLHQDFNDLLPLSLGERKAAIRQNINSYAFNVTSASFRRWNKARFRSLDRLARSQQLIDQLNSELNLSRVQRLLKERDDTQLGILKEFDIMDEAAVEIKQWRTRLTAESKRELRDALKSVDAHPTKGNMLIFRTSQLLPMLERYTMIGDASWFHLHSQLEPATHNMHRVLMAQHSLRQIKTGRARINQMLTSCIADYEQFHVQLKAWQAGYEPYLNQEILTQLLKNLEEISDRARKIINKNKPPKPVEANDKGLFQSEDNQWLVGDRLADEDRFTTRSMTGHIETWEPASQGKYSLATPAPVIGAHAPLDIDNLIFEARKRLQTVDAYEQKVQGYARQDMLPVNLEHMLVSEARELELRATKIASQRPAHELVPELQDKARRLKLRGRDLRTTQTLRSKKPTNGMLDDLVEHDVVEIRKQEPMKNLGKRKDGRTDYLQEYEVWVKRDTPRLLWYAHFHYGSPNARLLDFEKAHLKLPEHRFITRAEEPTLPHGEIGKQSSALRHFPQD